MTTERYEPKLIYYPERDEFEYIREDVPTVAMDIVPNGFGVSILLDLTTREPIGFSVLGAMVRDASPPPTTERKRVLEEAARVAVNYVFTENGQQHSNLAVANNVGQAIAAAIRALSSPLRPEGEAATQAGLISRLLGGNQDKAASPVDRLRLYAHDASSFDFDQDDAEAIVELLSDVIAALSARPQPPQQPVAWRLKDYADGWMLCHSEAMAKGAAGNGNLIEPLYAAPLAQPVTKDDHQFAVVSSDYEHPFLLGAYSTLEKAVKAQGGSPDKWHIFERYAAAQPVATAGEREKFITDVCDILAVACRGGPLEPYTNWHSVALAIAALRPPLTQPKAGK